jgi:hypothetical protein
MFRSRKCIITKLATYLWISWKKLYHCTLRNSSSRPIGQTLPAGETTPAFGPSRLIDFEWNCFFITTDANVMGEMIPINEAEDIYFGMVLLNDWSARYSKMGICAIRSWQELCFIYITLDCYYGCFRDHSEFKVLNKSSPYKENIRLDMQ